MEVPWAVTADMAHVDDRGKIHLLGVFGRITLTELPKVYQRPIFFVASLRIPIAEWEFERTVLVKCAEEDGHEIFKTPELKIAAIKGKGDTEADIPIIVEVPTMKFEHEGKHQWSLLVNGTTAKTVPMTVRLKE